MAITIVHALQSAVADAQASGYIKPSNWNAGHVITLAASSLLGRYANTPGAAQEISLVDLDLNNVTGVLSLSTMGGVAAGDYTNSNITVDSKGRITAVANGTASGGADASSEYILGSANSSYPNHRVLTDSTGITWDEGTANQMKADLVAAGVLAALLTVDGAGSGLDADLLDGQSSAFYSPASVSGTAAAILASLLTVDGAGSGLDADLLDGNSSAFFSPATVSGTAAAILASLLTVDGAGSGLDADLLDGQSSAFYATASSVSDHLADATAAHAASAISVAPSGTLAADDVQEALLEILGDIETHVADAAGAHAASAISYSAGGGISATDVQTAIAELDTEKLAAASYTAADVLSKLLTVDGSGSGLDADLLDGNSSAFYQAASTAITQGKRTIWIPASAMLAATTSGPASAQFETSTNDINYRLLDFDASADEHAHFNIAFPKSWDEGTVTFQVWWQSTATDTDGVAWGLQAIALSDNDVGDTAWGTAVVVTDDSQGAAGEILVSAESSAVTIGGTPAEGDVVYFRIFRDVSDANDDMTEDARLIGVKILFTTNAATDA
jgi:hypothetical protein